jgi:hypothetical protein
MIADSNSPTPLKYTDPTFQTLLFVRANIYDTSGGSPVLENTVNLALITQGTYYAKYSFTAGKTYLVQKLVYTDGTYVTVDQSYAQDNDDVQCIDLRTAELDVAVSTRNAIAPDNSDIAAIKVKTDQLLFNGDTGVVSHVINSISVSPDPNVALIKAKTDQLSFNVDTGVNAHTLNGSSGSTGSGVVEITGIVDNSDVEGVVEASQDILGKVDCNG